MTQIKDVAIEKTVADDGDYLILQNPTTAETYKIKVANFLGTVPSGNTPVETKLSGTAFGASPPYYAGLEFDKAFDQNLTTWYDYAYPSGGYCGLDLGSGNTKKLTKIRIYPRQDSGVQTRSGGARIQGSNSETTGYVDLFTFPATPNTGIWYEGIVQVSTAYRYIRYYAVDGAYCSIAEVEFYGI